ncbi:MAG TPA: hypothetical protein VL633_02335 [Bacteroidota bacterium]|nr:hypothetical protein [Bacteroidota bacterium]
MLRPEGLQIDSKEIGGLTCNVVSYSFGKEFHCHIDNVDPGTIIARSEAPTREEALLMAIAKATERLTSKTT